MIKSIVSYKSQKSTTLVFVKLFFKQLWLILRLPLHKSSSTYLENAHVAQLLSKQPHLLLELKILHCCPLKNVLAAAELKFYCCLSHLKIFTI